MKQNLLKASPEAELVIGCYDRALMLLRRNATPAGVLAASRSELASQRHYDCIFGRDAAISALGMSASGEADLVRCARAGLSSLGLAQAGNGQIANFLKPESGELDFWYTGCIDATLWWLIAVHWFDRLVGQGELARELAPQIGRSLHWLACQEHPAWGLVQQNEASDWADIMPRSGFVLYSNALWYLVKRLYRLPGSERTRECANQLFHPFDPVDPAPRRLRLMVRAIRERLEPTPFFLSFVNFSAWGDEEDLFGNLLAVLTGLAAPEHGETIVTALLERGANRPYPLRAVGTPIEPEDPLWRPYMLRHRQNLPWQYHNGGIWPFIGGFWVLLLHRLGRRDLAWRELAALALANRINDWEFNEWFHGSSGAPLGMPGQTWNAAMYLLACRTLEGRVDWDW